MMKLDEEIGVLTTHVIHFAHLNYPRDGEILKSVPGVGDITAEHSLRRSVISRIFLQVINYPVG